MAGKKKTMKAAHSPIEQAKETVKRIEAKQPVDPRYPGHNPAIHQPLEWTDPRKWPLTEPPRQ